MCKVCIDDDLKDVAGGLHTPIDDESPEREPIKENNKSNVDEKN